MPIPRKPASTTTTTASTYLYSATASRFANCSGRALDGFASTSNATRKGYAALQRRASTSATAHQRRSSGTEEAANIPLRRHARLPYIVACYRAAIGEADGLALGDPGA